jgi:hypothetical protein
MAWMCCLQPASASMCYNLEVRVEATGTLTLDLISGQLSACAEAGSRTPPIRDLSFCAGPASPDFELLEFFAVFAPPAHSPHASTPAQLWTLSPSLPSPPWPSTSPLSGR